VGRRVHAPPTGPVLDIDCGVGITTCWHALAHPQTPVVGVDRSPEAIACARRLADHVELDNVQFEVKSYDEGFEGLGTFQTILSVTSLYGDVWGHESMMSIFTNPQDVVDQAAMIRHDAASSAAAVAADGAVWWSLDRLPYVFSD